MAVYSHSKLSTFEQCKLKYKFRYIDKIKPPIRGTIEGHLGNSVHDSLEWLYKEVIKSNIPSLENVLEKYIETWQKNFDEDLLIAKKDMTAEDYFNKGIRFITDYYFKHQPFKDGTIDTERRVYIKIKDTKHLLVGYIDRLVHNRELDRYEIHDYKTANSLPNQDYFEKDRQLALYSIAIKEKYQKNVILTWHYLNHNIQVFSKRTDEQLKKLLEEIRKLIEEIESTTEFPPKKTVLCDWCEYKSICPAWGNKTPEEEKIKTDSELKIDKDFPTSSKYLK
jgi:putative RecB family exonuclease